MNYSGISNKIKYTLVLSMIFFVIVLGAIYSNMGKTVSQSQKETNMLNLLKNLEGIQLNNQIVENNKNDFLKNGQNVFLIDYTNATNNLRQDIDNLIQLSIKNNFEKENVLQLTNAVDKKISSTNRAVEIK